MQRDCRVLTHPFAGVVYVSLIAFSAQAIETGDPVNAVKEFEPGSVALIGAAAVYAARTIWELVLQQRREGKPDVGGDYATQRLVDLYSSHAHSEERILEQLSAAVTSMRDSIVRVAAQTDQNSAAIARLLDAQATLSQAIGQLNAAVQRCSRDIRGGA